MMVALVGVDAARWGYYVMSIWGTHPALRLESDLGAPYTG
jgi:hypothetical protein